MTLSSFSSGGRLVAAMLAAFGGLAASPTITQDQRTRRSVAKPANWGDRAAYDRYHHNMITSSPAEIAAWNAKVKRRNKRMLTT